MPPMWVRWEIKAVRPYKIVAVIPASFPNRPGLLQRLVMLAGQLHQFSKRLPRCSQIGPRSSSGRSLRR